MMDQYNHLRGLRFEHGVQDCYTMVQAVYREFCGLELTDYARPNDWWLHDKNLYVDNYKKEGFDSLDVESNLSIVGLRVYDILLVALPDQRDPNKSIPPNHAAVYLGDGMIIHHRVGKFSETKKLGGMIRNFTTHILRHPEVRRPSLPNTTVNLIDMILPHKKKEMENIFNGQQ